jgi:hypothetical protein
MSLGALVADASMSKEDARVVIIKYPLLSSGWSEKPCISTAPLMLE